DPGKRVAGHPSRHRAPLGHGDSETNARQVIRDRRADDTGTNHQDRAVVSTIRMRHQWTISASRNLDPLDLDARTSAVNGGLGLFPLGGESDRPFEGMDEHCTPSTLNSSHSPRGEPAVTSHRSTRSSSQKRTTTARGHRQARQTGRKARPVLSPSRRSGNPRSSAR
ncbi:MAG: hypothetical protein ACI9JD_003215, partial [Rhodococcus sp. (in: high G+C Gram-positive bacteria)]